MKDALRALNFRPTEFTTGAQYGVDTIAAETGLGLWPECIHRVVVPDDQHNAGIVKAVRFWGGERAGRAVQIEQMPRGSSYLNRNERMLDYADIVIAFPSTQYEEKRSGTWATVRRARVRQLPLMIVPLDKTPGWIE